MSTGNENSLYILDVGLNGFLRIIVQEDDEIYTKIGDFSGISAAFKPVALTSDSSGNIFVADAETDNIYCWWWYSRSRWRAISCGPGRNMARFSLARRGINRAKRLLFNHTRERWSSSNQGNFWISSGIKFVENMLWDKLDKRQKNLLKVFKAKTTSVPLRALVRYVYTNYPDDTVNSIIKEEILGWNN